MKLKLWKIKALEVGSALQTELLKVITEGRVLELDAHEQLEKEIAELKKILEYLNEKSKADAELEALKDQENYEIMEAEIKAERKREGG